MTGDYAARAEPLMPSDPRQLGPYRMLGRLGEGGMGTVFLAESPGGRPVAVKMIRPDLAHDPEFRQRFRSEVDRARQVPPFCTAEVIDADPEHTAPYLVVEYVDGPSLSSVVRDRGPLTPANLHGLAIGVATALTAIHGAGVIHRDLKPSNVLLAPGSPKVIDFGIARAVHGTTGLTLTNQFVGTIAYMAPERFGSGAGTTLTPAADVFAWGAVVAYAGTGRTPFASDMPHVMAARILTQPPDLTGLDAPLAELVGHALAKDPGDRPTARDLLDRMLSGGRSQRVDLAAAALARQPALRVAAEEAQAATDQQPVGELATAVVPLDPGPGALAGATPGAQGAGNAPTTRLVAVVGRDGPSAPSAVPAPSPAAAPPAAAREAARHPAAQHPGGGTAATWQATRPSGPDHDPGRRSRLWSRVGISALALTVVVTVALVAGMLSGLIEVPHRATSSPSPAAAGQPSVAPSSAAPAGEVIAQDPLTKENYWHPVDDPTNKATCAFDGALVVTKRAGGPFRCPGLRDTLTDFAASVDVKLLAKGSCAGVWFRFSNEMGYALRVCADGYTVVTHGVGSPTAITVLRTLPFPVALNSKIRVGVTGRGGKFTFYRDGKEAGTMQDTTLGRGRVILGIFQEGPPDSDPFSVSFASVEVRSLGG
jgi:eukaryotic-like serine/threonine-protein kinase